MHEAELASHELSHLADSIRRVARRCVVGSQRSPKGNSYFGGMPRVPAEFKWPSKDGYPLSFVGQLACREFETDSFHEPDLPTRTVPSLFGLMSKKVASTIYKRTDVQFKASVSYPSYERRLIEMPDDVTEDCYLEFCESVRPEIQIGGYPAPIQCDTFERDCVTATGLGKEVDWVLLLQLLEIGDMIWGDAGALYWFVLREDLDSMRFDRVWMITQCH